MTLRPVFPIFCAFVCSLLVICSVSCTSVADAPGSEVYSEYYQIAESWAELGKYDKAIPYYKKAGQAENFRNAAHWGLARVYALSGKWADSQVLLEEMHVAEPENIRIAAALAYVLAKNKKSDQAAALYKAIFEKNPDNLDVGLNYGEILFAAGQFSETVALMDSLKSAFPGDEKMSSFQSLEQRAREALSAEEARKSAEGQISTENLSEF